MPSLWIVALIALQRACELAYSARNVRRLAARGGFEAAPGSYVEMVALHALFLLSLAAEAPRSVPLDLRTAACLAALVPVTALRYWAIGTLKERWTTRIMVVPERGLVRSGPYRFLRHPNYVAIVLELLLFPLLLRAPYTLVTFTAANAIVLSRRVAFEEAALRGA